METVHPINTQRFGNDNMLGLFSGPQPRYAITRGDKMALNETPIRKTKQLTLALMDWQT
jgi:hypothetical protein